MTCHAPQTESGFTLMEVIIVIAVSAILAAVLIQFTGSGLIKSAEVVQHVNEDFSTDDVMEQITREYQAWLATGATDLTLFESQVRTTHAGAIDGANTGMVSIRPGEDDANSILQVTVAQGDFRVSALFTR